MEIAKLKAQRAAIRGRLTKLAREIAEDKIGLRILKASWARFLDRDLPLFLDLKVELEERGEDAAGLEADASSLYAAIGDCEEALHCLEQSVVAGSSKNLAPVAEHPVEPPAPHRAQSGWKLPTLKVPLFDGATSKWLEFKDSFEELIGAAEIGNAYKLQYLKNSVTGSAATLISGIPLGQGSFQAAWDLLCDRYDKKGHLAAEFLEMLFRGVYAEEIRDDAASLRSFVETAQLSLTVLLRLGAVEGGDLIIVRLLSARLPRRILKEWAAKGSDLGELPSKEEFMAFLTREAELLENQEAIQRNFGRHATRQSKSDNDKRPRPGTQHTSFMAVPKAPLKKCDFCKKVGHILEYCRSFKDLKASERMEIIRKDERCLRCLSITHTTKNCTRNYACICGCGYHVLLHQDRSNTGSSNSQAYAARVASAEGSVLLATARVRVVDSSKHCGNRMARCLLDSGSQRNVITSECCKALGLEIRPCKGAHLHGIGGEARVLGYCVLKIAARLDDSVRIALRALVVENITDQLPSARVKLSSSEELQGLPLADDTWNKPGKIDLILGAEVFSSIYIGDKVSPWPKGPTAIATKLGYVLMGGGHDIENGSLSAFALEGLLEKFWTIEEVPRKSYLSVEEEECEKLYTATTEVVGGRFRISLPFSRNPEVLGNSRSSALRRFLSLERKLNASPELKLNYSNVLKDYLTAGILTEVINDSESSGDEGYYIPHHAVIRADKPLPRIVLDASSKTSSGVSLNDILHAGPNLQADLLELLLNFRLFPIALSADIKQMYLQIEVKPEHRKYLKLLFRFENNRPIKAFKFNRLPFGLRASPYLAMKTVKKLANNYKTEMPEAAKVAETSLYMDDLVHSVENVTIGKKMAKELIDLFKKGSFELVKWTSNSASVLKELPDTHRRLVDLSERESASKILGLTWDPVEDAFCFNTDSFPEKCTKRTILSTVARLFDVMGLVAPTIMYSKLLIKELWVRKVDWDEAPPDSIVRDFRVLTRELPLLAEVKIPRHSGACEKGVVNLVAFCDASQKGYGSVVYLHTTVGSKVSVTLLCAKSKVSPTKVVTLARLELCAAVLMSKLIKYVREIYDKRIRIQKIYAFSDSTIALSWIQSSPHRWSVFVSNRVALCQENLDSQSFYHISGTENPSDCLSRGASPKKLIENRLWWYGPQWLSQPVENWPIVQFNPPPDLELPEEKVHACMMTSESLQGSLLCEMSLRVSSWQKLLNIVVFVLKFIKRAPSADPVENITRAERVILRAVQEEAFHGDILELKKNRPVSSKLQRLSVFMDPEGILRIGGRLKNSDLPFEVKHPVLMPKRHHIVNLIIRYQHVMNAHAGPELLMSILRQQFWILDARTVIRSITRSCTACFRVRPTNITPTMADLPKFRLQEAKPFIHTGVDYAGPLRITLTRRRGQHSQKAYICLFVCMVIKAVHIELVSDLTTDAFLSAFKRFLARRGPVTTIYSDNGTNFVGAKAELGLINERLRDGLATQRVSWKMIPPRAPHFGGLWEANIKSVKNHLARVIGDQLLSYEEMSTVLAQIECLLNSRPLCAMSSDPNPEVITPAHFLTTTPLKFLPVPASLEELERVSLRSRKQLLDQLVQSFWKKWREEFLHTLQARGKWERNFPNLSAGTVVVVERENCAPLRWPLGVVTETFPGADGVVRVASVRCEGGVFKRSVRKLYPVPLAED